MIEVFRQSFSLFKTIFCIIIDMFKDICFYFKSDKTTDIAFGILVCIALIGYCLLLAMSLFSVVVVIAYNPVVFFSVFLIFSFGVCVFAVFIYFIAWLIKNIRNMLCFTINHFKRNNHETNKRIFC